MSFEVTVTSLHPPRLCRIAVFSIKPTFLSCDKLESDDDVARKIADKLVLMAQEFQSLSDACSSDHDAGSSDYNAVRDDELIDP